MMRKFIINMCRFILILLIINTVIYFVGKKLYFGSYENHDLKMRTYLLSDSRGQALNDIAEKYGVHNFSHGSDSYADMLRKTRYLIRNSAADTIYISADEHSLTSYREKKNNSDRSVYYCDPDDLGGKYEYFKQKYVKRYIALFRPEIAEVIKLYKPASKRKPVQWADRDENDRRKRAEKRVATNFPDDTESEILKEDLMEIIYLCRSENIELIGIKFPLPQEYLDASASKKGSADELLKENGCRVIDGSLLFTADREYFADQDHLNDEGAKKFTENIFGSIYK